MSKDLPQPQQSEEVDLGQLFKLIGNAFDRLFKFIGSIFNKLFLAFVWMVFFVKKHFIKLVIAGVVGIGIGVLLEKTSDPVYKSYITVKQNYATGEDLYNSISYYNDLLKQNDAKKTLSKILEIEESEASSILGFDIESVITENQKLKEFDSYLKELDTTLAKTVKYETYLENSKDYMHQYQQLTIKSKERNNFKKVFDNIVNNINNNDYFKREQKKDSLELANEFDALNEALEKSESLQETYKHVLEKSLNEKEGSQTNVTIEGSGEKSKTKEFDLYKSDLEIRQKRVENESKQEENRERILEVVSSKQDSGTIDNKKELLGRSVSAKLFYGFIFTLLTFIVLLGLQFVKFLERYKN